MDLKMKPLLSMLVSLFLVVSLLLSGCGISLTPTNNETESPVEPPLIEPNPEPVSPGISPSYGGEPVVYVSKAPRVGETVNVTLSWEMLGTPVEPFNKVWLEFERYDPALYYPLGRGTDKDRLLRFLSEKFDSANPYDVYEKDAATYQPVATVPHKDIVVDGTLVWEGAPLKPGDKVKLAGMVRFPTEGEWVVYARFQAEGRFPWSQSEVRLTIGKDSGVFGWPKDYEKGGGWQRPTENAPLSVTLKPARAPLLGQPLNLTVVIQSIRDVPEGLVYLRFFRQEGSMSNWNADYRIEGNLSWNGSLKKGMPVYLSGNVTFNIEGDWSIQAWSKTPESTSLSGANNHNLYLHVGKVVSRYGWTGSAGPISPPVKGTPTPTPPPVPKPVPVPGAQTQPPIMAHPARVSL